MSIDGRAPYAACLEAHQKDPHITFSSNVCAQQHHMGSTGRGSAHPFPFSGMRASGGEQVQRYLLFFRHCCPMEPKAVCRVGALTWVVTYCAHE